MVGGKCHHKSSLPFIDEKETSPHAVYPGMGRVGAGQIGVKPWARWLVMNLHGLL